jgi:hypothetical protein
MFEVQIIRISLISVWQNQLHCVIPLVTAEVYMEMRKRMWACLVSSDTCRFDSASKLQRKRITSLHNLVLSDTFGDQCDLKDIQTIYFTPVVCCITSMILRRRERAKYGLGNPWRIRTRRRRWILYVSNLIRNSPAVNITEFVRQGEWGQVSAENCVHVNSSLVTKCVVLDL